MEVVIKLAIIVFFTLLRCQRSNGKEAKLTLAVEVKRPPPVLQEKRKIEENLKNVYGRETALPDFLFNGKTSLNRYLKANGPPISKTSLKIKSIPHVRKPSILERILAQSLSQISKGINVKEISIATQELVRVQNRLSVDQIKTDVTGGIKLATKGSTDAGKISLAKSSVRQRREAIPKQFEDIIERHKMWAGKMSDPNEDFYRDLLIPGVDQSEDFFTSEDSVYSRAKRSLNPVYTGVPTCYSSGSPFDQRMVHMCGVCYRIQDFGPNVIPRYAVSVECQNSAGHCLLGNGVCVQKVIHYNFRRLSNNKWIKYKQPLNTGCECQCLRGSMIHSYFI